MKLGLYPSLLLVLTSHAFAAAGDNYWVTEVAAVNVKHKECESENYCSFDRVADITVRLKGCADEIVSNSFSVQTNGDKVAIQGSVMAKESPFSGTVYCFAPPTKTFTVSIGAGLFENSDVTVTLTPGSEKKKGHSKEL